MYGGWHNKRWIYAVWAKPPFDPYSPPWPPPPRQPVSAGDARSGKRREDAACRVSTAHVREGHNAVAVTPARWRVLRESCAR